MRIHPIVPLVLIVSTVIAANRWECYPGTTDFTSRGSVGTNAGGGEIMQEVSEDYVTGMGDDGNALLAGAPITGFGMLLQDQNTDTRETYHVVYRGGTKQRGPDTGMQGLLGRKGPFTSPPRGTGGPTQAWDISLNYGSAPVMVPVRKFYAFGLDLSPAPGWTADGLSVHMSRGEGAFAQSRQSARAGGGDVAWQLINNVVSHPSLERTWRMRIIAESAMLQIGNGGTLYGKGGMQPNPGSPLSVRARYGSAGANQTSLLVLGLSRFLPGVSITPGMKLFLGSPYIFVLNAPTNASGEAVYNLGTTPVPSPGVTLHFQAGLASPLSPLVLTNLASVDI